MKILPKQSVKSKARKRANNKNFMSKITHWCYAHKKPIKPLCMVSAVFLFGLLTALTFLYVAGRSDLSRNWPVNFELTYMDNPFLFLFARNLFEHTPILFSTSGQSFLFPEIPISLLSYLLSAGSIYWYYVIVAAINNMALFALLAFIVSRLFTNHTFAQKLARTFIAASPLVILLIPAFDNTYTFHIAPTYNFDLYFGSLLTAVIILTRSKYYKALVSAIWVLIAASNMLVLIFSIPIIILIGLLLFLRDGWRKPLRLLLLFGCLSVASVVLNFLLFKLDHSGWFVSIRGAAASGYINLSGFQDNMNLVSLHFQLAERQTITRLSILAAITCLFIALYNMRLLFRRQEASTSDERTLITKIYISLLPIAGVFVCYTLTLLYEFYLWWPFVGSIVVVLLLLTPRRIVVKGALLTLALFTIFLLHNNNIANSRNVYFEYSDSLTKCADNTIPTGSYAYGSYSNGKVIASTSQDNLRILQSNFANYRPDLWLNNTREREAVKGPVHYVVIAENHITKGVTNAYKNGAVKTFGNPTKVIVCPYSANQSVGEVWFYEKDIFDNTSVGQ